ncbi:hypothetical protein N658DRAFT_501547 [Parathielavia hyrcaniae]|uniref:Uncharacterized protein n=1 Tax=Parathielavia hyrcaniae TaxID=113614 RepID=A0AAN6SXI0_9PEZI|nr:hypothetical protein N658DRAFT_501547 [Parathielavia hyrcaniae]
MPSSNRSSSTSSSASDTSKKPKTWRILSTEYKELGNGKQFSRKIDLKTGLPKTEWQEVAKPPSSSSGSSQEEQHKLYLVLQKQAEGEPDHWSLFATRGGELTSARGKVWQVKGDALSMRHVPANNVAIFASGSFKAHYVLCSNLTADMENKVEAAAAREAPPKAANQAAVVENCQGWTIRVLRRLEKEGVVKKETVNQMSKLKQPIRK